MDKVKVILGHLQKHHFWLLCLVCIVCGFVAWNMAAGKLSKDYDSRKSAINTKFTALEGILNEPNFPNESWKTAADKLTNEQKEKVRVAWQQVYDEQAPYLKWPEFLGEDFLKQIQALPQGSEIPFNLRERYASLINQDFPRLLAIIGAKKHGENKDSALPGAEPAMPQDTVVWSDDSQQAIESSLQFEKGTPAALEVWLTQENLWVYQVLLSIIKNVNADRYVPAVKRIEELSIAQQAAKTFEAGMAAGKIEKPAVAPQPGAEGGIPGADAGAGATGGEGQEGEPAPDAGRYVDAEGKPMATPPTPQDPFKRMPISMKLIIDQREIPKLLVECANSPLPVEIHQLRINPDAKANKSKSSGAPADSANAPQGTFDVPVELCGIIYIYNPPDKQRLGTGAADGAAPPATDEGAAAPVATGG
ncbi:MAG: hypothetical protein AB7O59_11760 [Pirellulales bacterium]